MANRYEGSKSDMRSDRVGKRERNFKGSDAAWEASQADRRADTMRDYKSYRHLREPKRERLYVEAKGPWMKDGGQNRDPHNSFVPPQGDDQ